MHQKLGVLINNAGVFRGFLVEDTKLVDFERCINVNYLGQVRMCKVCIEIINFGIYFAMVHL